MTLDPKALKAAFKAHSEFASLNSVIQAYLDAADLADGKSFDELKKLCETVMAERDEARLEARALDAGLDIASKKIEQEKGAKEKSRRENDALSKKMAALREALENTAEYFDEYADAEYLPYKAAPTGNTEMRLMGELRAALTDTATAKAAVQYQRVPHGWHVVQLTVDEDVPVDKAPTTPDPEDGG